MCSKLKFYDHFKKLIFEKKDNSVYLCSEKYIYITKELKSAKSGKKSSALYRCVKTYDIIIINKEEKLIFPVDAGDMSILQYVQNESMYVLPSLRINIDHDRKRCIIGEVKEKQKY